MGTAGEQLTGVLQCIKLGHVQKCADQTQETTCQNTPAEHPKVPGNLHIGISKRLQNPQLPGVGVNVVFT